MLQGIVLVWGLVFSYILEYCKSRCDNQVPMNRHSAAYLDCQRCDANISSYLRHSHTVHLPPCSCKRGSSHQRLQLRVTWAKLLAIS